MSIVQINKYFGQFYPPMGHSQNASQGHLCIFDGDQLHAGVKVPIGKSRQNTNRFLVKNKRSAVCVAPDLPDWAARVNLIPHPFILLPPDFIQLLNLMLTPFLPSAALISFCLSLQSFATDHLWYISFPPQTQWCLNGAASKWHICDMSKMV